MNIAITDGLQLMPPGFEAGLAAWSRTNGTSGSSTWDTASNAAIVPADQDFGACLEIYKNRTTTRLRFMGETPMLPGIYLRVSARVKIVAGPLCKLRIAGWAGDGDRNHVAGVPETGPEVQLSGYGEVVEVSAIVGVGARDGVDLSWGTRPVFGHFGLDIIGNNGGAIRVESIRIEDVTSAFIPSLIDWVDVRDYGAVGDGVTDDRDAFIAADQAARGGTILVPEGTFRIGSDLSISAPIRFKGKLSTPADARIALVSSFDFPTYADAFGDETLGFKKALQALFGYTDHDTLDLGGRRVDLTEPLRPEDFAPDLDRFGARRVICNGQIMAKSSNDWESRSVESYASYVTSDSGKLTEVSNVAAIEVGSRIEGQGVGREVYVTARDIEAATLTLSQPFFGANSRQKYSFTRDRYLFDFSGMSELSRLVFNGVNFHCNDISSAVMLPPDGRIFEFLDCQINRPKDRGITSIGRACQGIVVDRCQFESSEQALPVSDRTTTAININANDAKIRNNRAARFNHFLVMNGGGHTITGNHIFQGDGIVGGIRGPGIVLTRPNNQVTISTNYIDNCSIEWTNEHDAYPWKGPADTGFNGMTVTGNHFLCSEAANWFSWLILKPYGSGHFISGMTVLGNVFKSLYAQIERIDRVDTTYADLDYGAMKNINVSGNCFEGVQVQTANPMRVRHNQSSASTVWNVAPITEMPFGGWARGVDSMVLEAPLTNAGGADVAAQPWTRGMIGSTRQQVRIGWPEATKGRAVLTVRMDDL